MRGAKLKPFIPSDYEISVLRDEARRHLENGGSLMIGVDTASNAILNEAINEMVVWLDCADTAEYINELDRIGAEIFERARY